MAAGGEERKVNYGRRKISGTCSCEKLVRVAVDDSSLFSFFRPRNKFVFIFFLSIFFRADEKRGVERGRAVGLVLQKRGCRYFTMLGVIR